MQKYICGSLNLQVSECYPQAIYCSLGFQFIASFTIKLGNEFLLIKVTQNTRQLNKKRSIPGSNSCLNTKPKQKAKVKCEM